MTTEELTNKERAIRDAADLAKHPARQALLRITEGLGYLPHGGNATARICFILARERLDAAISHLPEA